MQFVILLLILLFGFLLTYLITENMQLLERFGLALPMGLGLITLFMFCYSTIGIKITLNSLIITLIISNSLTLFLVKIFKRKINIFLKISKLTNFEKILTTSVFGILLLSLLIASYFPIYIWDALALYDFRAKVIADFGFYSQIAKNYYWFDGYPLFTSLSHAIIYLSGGTNPQFLYSLMFSSFVLVFYCLLRQYINRTQSLVVTLILSTTPAIFDHSTFSYTNLPYSIFLSLGSIYLFIWFSKYKGSGYLVLSAILTGLSTWTRSTEPFWAINIIFLFILLIYKFKKYFLPFFIYVVTFFLIKTPWSYVNYYILNQASTNKPSLIVSEASNYLGALTGTKLNLDRIWEVFEFIYKNVITSWYPLLFLFLLMIIVNIKNILKTKNSIFLLMIIMYFGFLIYATYVYSQSVSYWKDIPDSARRMSMFFMPMMIYYIGISYGKK